MIQKSLIAAIALTALSVGVAAGSVAAEVLLPEMSATPLTLQGQGSFTVGGEKVKQSFVEMGKQRAEDTVTVNQMYVEYMVPAAQKLSSPMILMHGAGQSGAIWNTTPDGRMGWFEYFVRQNHPVYVIDQVGRARSGFNQAIFNRVAAGEESADKQPLITRPGDMHALWINMRVGPKPGEVYKDAQFPAEAFDRLSAMGIPDLTSAVPTPNPSFQNVADLSAALQSAVVVGHSQSGDWPIRIAQKDPQAVKAMVLVEPGTCRNNELTDEDLKKLSHIPLLVIYGDHLEASTELPAGASTWKDRLESCRTVVKRMNAAGGTAALWHLPAMDIHGNSHMLMQDRNNLTIGRMLEEWLQKPTRTN